MSRTPINRVGERHGSCVVISLTPRRERKRAVWVVQCDCGETFERSFKRNHPTLTCAICKDVKHVTANDVMQIHQHYRGATEKVYFTINKADKNALDRACEIAGVSRIVLLRRMVVPFLRAVK